MAVLYTGAVLYSTTTGSIGQPGQNWSYLGTVSSGFVQLLNFTVHVQTSGTLTTCPATTVSYGYDAPVPQAYIDSQTWGMAPPPALTDADRQRAERARAARRRARDRAMELLMSVLSAEQAHAYVRDGWFEARGSAGGLFRVYRRGQQGNVREVIGGREVASYCCHPPDHLPDADAHLAQLLHLETDEPGFRATANRTELYQPMAA